VRLLITGATGFIGRHLLAELAGRHELIALTRGGPPSELAGLAEWIAQDLAEPIVTTRLPGRVDGIIHLAQSARYKEFPAGAADVYAVNVHSTFDLIEWGRQAGAGVFILASTGGVYRYSDRPVREDDPVDPGGFYFRSKYAAEVLLGAYGESLRPVILRPFFVYGADQREMLIPTLVDRVLSRKEILVEGDPGLRVNPIHVEDAVRVFEPALTRAVSGVVNIAGPDALAIGDMVRLLGETLKLKPVLRHREARADGDLVAATERMRTELGVVPRVGIRAGLERIAADVLSTRV
jgi:nucleoside-diphosphate-sugar epimerase